MRQRAWWQDADRQSAQRRRAGWLSLAVDGALDLAIALLLTSAAATGGVALVLAHDAALAAPVDCATLAALSPGCGCPAAAR